MAWIQSEHYDDFDAAAAAGLPVGVYAGSLGCVFSSMGGGDRPAPASEIPTRPAGVRVAVADDVGNAIGRVSAQTASAMRH